MRVTLGERLGLRARGTKVSGRRPISECDGVPREVEPEYAGPVVRLREAPSSTLPYGRPFVRPDDDGPPRVRGEMVWTHKTAPTLVIEGRPDLSPEEHAAGRRR